jgi:hypothetical protein
MTSQVGTRAGVGRAGRWLLLAGLLLAALGSSFAPWVDRSPAALPEVRAGSLAVQRLLFLLPLAVVTLSLPMVAAARQLAYPRWVRWLVLAATLPLALTLLPPVWSPPVFVSDEFRLQTVACGLGLGLVAVSPLLKGVPARWLAALLLPLSLAAPGLALWQFFVVQEAVTRAYASPVVPGWGAWATVAGFALAILGALLYLLHRQSK